MEENIEEIRKRIRLVLTPERWRILQELSERPTYARDLAKRLGLNEQNTYFHIRQLAKEGLLVSIRHESIHGGIATIWKVPRLVWRLSIGSKSEAPEALLSTPLREFAMGDSFRGILVCGAPEPHGPLRATARDSHLIAELTWFLGWILALPQTQVIFTDIEVNSRNLWETNMLVTGGPITNMIAAVINDSVMKQTLGIQFSPQGNAWGLESPNGTHYVEPEIGVVALVPNPRDPRFCCLLLAGVGIAGTKAAIRAVCDGHIGLAHDQQYQGWIVRGIDSCGNGGTSFDGVLETIYPT